MRIKHMMILSALCLSMMATSCSSHSTETAPETTKKEVAIQLYSVRGLVKDGSNLDQILKDLADMAIPVWRPPTTMTVSSTARLPRSSNRWWKRAV